MPKVIVKVINVAGLKIEFNDYTSFDVTIEDVKKDIFDAKGFKVAVLQIHNTTIVNSTTFDDDSTLQDVLDDEHRKATKSLVKKRRLLSELNMEHDNLKKSLHGAYSQQVKLFELEQKIADVDRQITDGVRRTNNIPREITVIVRMITGFKQFST